jgi:alkylation response protein AidB-like acyl-CoA dehydrogenase
MTQPTTVQAFDEDIRELVGVVDEACRSLGGTTLAKELTGGGDYNDSVWKTLGVDIGLAALGLPDELGGLGGLHEMVAVAETVGRYLLPIPFVATVLGTQVLSRCGPRGHEAVHSAVNGRSVVVAVDGGHNGSGAAAFTASAGAISGTSPAVLGGADAELLIVAAGETLYLIEVSGPGCEVIPVNGLDLTRRWSRVLLENAPATMVSDNATRDLADALDVAQLLLCAEGLGGAQACLDMTVNYVKERRQFSRPIGSFQSIKHILADLLVSIEMARSAIDRALYTDPDNPRAFAEAVSTAQLWCSTTYRQVTAETVQLHGGIGFTWDHDAHLYFRRARSDVSIFGGDAMHRARLITVLDWLPAAQ